MEGILHYDRLIDERTLFFDEHENQITKELDNITLDVPVLLVGDNYDYNATENYYAVKFDAERVDTVRFQGYAFVPGPSQFGRKGTHQLAAAMLQNKMSYPSYVIFNEELREIQVIPGYQETKNFLPILHFFAEDAYLKKSWKDFLIDYQK